MNQRQIRETVLQSLSAIGATQEAKYYAELFAAQDPERFALIVIDPRCLKNPLLEALISSLRILSDLSLTPVLLVGVLDPDRTSTKFQTHRLASELEQAKVRAVKLNTATYGLIEEVRKRAKSGAISILEMTETGGKMTLPKIIAGLHPAKVIFLQPSGGLSRNGDRIPVVNIDAMEQTLDTKTLTPGQKRFVDLVGVLSRDKKNSSVYVMASPLNLLPELFTTQGSGTLFRNAAKIRSYSRLPKTKIKALKQSIETAFEKPIDPEFFKRPVYRSYIEQDYRGGAIFTQLAGLPYLSKFWVVKAARGERIARDIWEYMCADIPAFFWRSRVGNPFNDWYMRACDGMQLTDGWRVFWKGLDAPEVPRAILAASSAPDDFLTQAAKK